MASKFICDISRKVHLYDKPIKDTSKKINSFGYYEMFFCARRMTGPQHHRINGSQRYTSLWCISGPVVISLSVVMAFVFGGVITAVVVISCFKRFVIIALSFCSVVNQIMLISKNLNDG